MVKLFLEIRDKALNCPAGRADISKDDGCMYQVRIQQDGLAMLQKLLSLGILLMASPIGYSADELIHWHGDLNEARRVAQQYKVPLLIHFYGDQCLPCRTLEQNVFTRPEIASTMQRYFVPVKINATHDRKTAALYGVHSWPTDVFVAADGKTLSQGVCNQNANAYLQGLQNMAIMNRDRNALLAASPPPNYSTSKTPQSVQAAPQLSHQPQLQRDAYGRTVAANLQQAAPGRENAPSPYSNPTGPNPYAQPEQSNGPSAIGQTSIGQMSAAPSSGGHAQLTSPTWTGQTAHGQATNGLVNSGPITSSSNTQVSSAVTGMNQTHKDANLPPSVQWQAGGPKQSTSTPAAPAYVEGMPAAKPPVVASTPSIPSLGTPSTAGKFPSKAQNSLGSEIVENPHFGPSSASKAIQAQLTSSNIDLKKPSNLAGVDTKDSDSSAVSPPNQASTTSQLKPEASIPALSGFCPVSLLATGQWVDGLPQHAIRHRGRVYFLSSEEAVQKFLASPDSYCPVLSGYDPLILLREGRLVEGSVYDGLKDPKQRRILLFSSSENKKHFHENYDRLAAEIDAMLSGTQPMTANAGNSKIVR